MTLKIVINKQIKEKININFKILQKIKHKTKKLFKDLYLGVNKGALITKILALILLMKFKNFAKIKMYHNKIRIAKIIAKKIACKLEIFQNNYFLKLAKIWKLNLLKSIWILLEIYQKIEKINIIYL